MSRYKTWRSVRDKNIHLVCAEGAEAFEALPDQIRHLGPWQGAMEGDVASLRLAYRVMLAEQGFVIVYAHLAQIELEARGKPVAAKEECPMCQGSGHVPRHGGLKEKDCPRCRGRGWLEPRR